MNELERLEARIDARLARAKRVMEIAGEDDPTDLDEVELLLQRAIDGIEKVESTPDGEVTVEKGEDELTITSDSAEKLKFVGNFLEIQYEDSDFTVSEGDGKITIKKSG